MEFSGVNEEEQEMKKRPIIFNTKMVKAILDGEKSQTRRIIKPQPEGADYWTVHKEPWYTKEIFYPNNKATPSLLKCPYGKVGDMLWVRETFCLGEIVEADSIDGYSEGCYVSQCSEKNSIIMKEYCLRNNISIDGVIWKPSIHMPRQTSRILLEITDIRIEMVQDIKNVVCDIYAEGLPKDFMVQSNWQYPIDWFRYLWDSSNTKQEYKWEVNPWVWVITFIKK